MAYLGIGDKILAQRRAQRAQEEARNNYEAQKEAIDNKYNGGLGGFLGGIVGGIGKGIGDVGKGVFDLLGTGVAATRDLGSIITTGQSAGEQDKFQKWLYNTDDTKDAWNKASGTTLNAATTLATTALPAAGAGSALGKATSGVLSNTAAGAIGGLADELQYEGKDASLDSATNRALSGAAAGLAAGKVGSKIGNAKSGVGRALLNNKLATSTIGRGAISGAVGGGFGGGTSAALSGGDVIGSALEGAKSGAVAGGAQAGIMSAANSLKEATVGKAMKNNWERQQDRNFENAIKNPSAVKDNIYLGELSDKNYADVSNVLNKVGLTKADGDAAITVKNNAMYLTPEGAQHLHDKRIVANNMTAERVLQTMRNATRNGVVSPNATDRGNATIGAGTDSKRIDIAHLGAGDNGDLALMSTYPASSGETYNQIKNTLDGSRVRHATSADGTGLAAGASALQGTDNSIAQNVKNVNTEEDYRMAHRPNENGVFAYDLNNSAANSEFDTWAPNDVYDNPQYYIFSGSDKAKAEAASAVKALKGASPEQKVKIYRATTGDSINPGDWITLSKEYANGHNDSWLEGKGKVVEMEVPAKDIRWAGDDLQEWGYFPQAQTRTQASETAATKTPTEYEEPVLPDYTTPTDYQGNQLKIRNKNLVEKAGEIMSGAGEAIKNRDIYNSLYSKTANRVTRNDSINKLRELGFEPGDYAEAAKISTTTNKFVDDIVKNSQAKVTDQSFAEKILTPADDIIISDPAYQKKYDIKVRALLDRIETGAFPGQYNASDLLKESRKFGDWANDIRKKSTNVNGDIINRDGYELADAYTDVKYALRDLASTAVDGFGDNYTKKQLSERLTKLGAPQKAIDYILDAEDIGGFIRNTALFEDARQMSREMSETKIRRNAVSGKSTNPLTVALNAAGVPQLLEAALSPIGRATGGLAKATGEMVQKVGSRLPERGQSELSPELQLILGNYLGRTSGQAQANSQMQEAQKQEDYNNLRSLELALQANEQELASTAPVMSQEAIQLQNELNRISGAMDNALAAGDLSAYNQLANLYKTAYSMYNLRNPQEAELSQTEKTRQAKFQNADAALSQLENMFSTAGGAQGNIRGGLATWLSSLGMNDTINSYNQSAKSLINQISAATGTIDKGLIPQVTDSEEEAEQKIAELKRLLQQSKASYANAYGWA